MQHIWAKFQGGGARPEGACWVLVRVALQLRVMEWIDAMLDKKGKKWEV